MIHRTGPTVQTQSKPIATSQPSWQQLLTDAVSDPEELLKRLQLPASLLPELRQACRSFALRVPAPYLALIEPGRLDDPLLLQVLPQAQELVATPGYDADPLQEAESNPNPGLIHKYHGRVLLMTSGACAINCRYCFRRHFPYADNQLGKAQWQQILDYLAADPQIEEVIFSGGDPLATPDARLMRMLDDLEQLSQLKRLRIHSRLPVVIPQRLTDALLQRLHQSRLQPVLVLHTNHPRELAPELQQRLLNWRHKGVTLLNQSVLLKGVNDCAEILIELSQRLFDCGVLPYYLHLLDPVQGAAHFDIDEASAQVMAGQMAARLPGYLVPKLTRERAGASAKLPLLPDLP